MTFTSKTQYFQNQAHDFPQFPNLLLLQRMAPPHILRCKRTSRLHTTHSLFHITHFQTSTDSLPPESPHTSAPEMTPRSVEAPVTSHWDHHRHLPLSFQSAPAATAKPLQSCPTLCDPNGSPPGSSVPGILQARILEWVAISFSSA